MSGKVTSTAHVYLKIVSCGECPYHKVGPSYSFDGFDRGNDWHGTKADRVLASFVERPSEQPNSVPVWCPLRKRGA